MGRPASSQAEWRNQTNSGIAASKSAPEFKPRSHRENRSSLRHFPSENVNARVSNRDKPFSRTPMTVTPTSDPSVPSDLSATTSSSIVRASFDIFPRTVRCETPFRSPIRPSPRHALVMLPENSSPFQVIGMLFASMAMNKSAASFGLLSDQASSGRK